MAARLATGDPQADPDALEQALQQFVNHSPWDPVPVRRRLAQRMTAALAPAAWVIDLHRLPDRQAGPPRLRHRAGRRMADRHRHHRRRLPIRHLVGDRLDITGVRWDLHGAEAVLKLRPDQQR
jgi:hypothetical protein